MKKILCMLLALLMLLTVVSCGESTTSKKTDPPKDQTETPDSKPDSKPTPSDKPDVNPPVTKKNELLDALKLCTVVETAKKEGSFAYQMAEKFTDVAAENKVLLEMKNEDTEKDAKMVHFGRNEKTPAEFTKDLRDADYYIGVKEGELYIVGGSDYALEEAVKAVSETLKKEEATLPITYKAEKGKGAIKLRAATFSIQAGNQIGHDFKIIAEDIVRNQIDIIGLQFVDMNTTRNKNQDTLKIIAENTDLKYYKFIKTVETGGGEFGNAIMSRYPIEKIDFVEIPSSGEKRVVGCAVIDVNGVKTNFLTTQLSWDGSYATQKKQLSFVAETYKKLEGNTILAINANAPLNDDFKALFPEHLLANGQPADFDSCVGYGAFDNVVITNQNTVALSRGMDDEVSHADHYLVWIEFVFTNI